MIWITTDDIILIHSHIIKGSGGLDGLRDRAGLEAAIAAPMQSFGGQDLFPSEIEKSASWFWSCRKSRFCRWKQENWCHDGSAFTKMEWLQFAIKDWRIGRYVYCDC